MASTEVKDYWKSIHKRMGIHRRDEEVKHVEFARFICDQYRDELMYVDGLGWHRWNGVVWEAQEDDAPAFQTVTDAAELLVRHGPSADEGVDWVLATANKMMVNRERKYIVEEMRNLREFRAAVSALDAKPHLLAFQNGTVNLRTKEFRKNDPADMMTQCARVNYNPKALCERWKRFVREVFPDEPELQDYYQTFLGQCITGEVKDHVLGVWYGEHGRNGKGTTIRTMQKVFGSSLIHEVPFETFERSRGGPHTEVIAGMRGARMVVAQEGNQGAPMDTARLKNYSGGDLISARHLYGKQFTFQPNFTLVLATNHLPEFATGGAALWARTHAVLFGQSFADRVDIDLEPTIQGPEAEGVAAWIVEGAFRYYQANRLNAPVAVLKATEMHKEEVDPLKDLVGEIFVYDEHSFTPSREFNLALKQWRTDNGDTTNKYAPGAVKRHLLNSGKVAEKRLNNRNGFSGVRLESPSTTPQVAPGHMNSAV